MALQVKEVKASRSRVYGTSTPTVSGRLALKNGFTAIRGFRPGELSRPQGPRPQRGTLRTDHVLDVKPRTIIPAVGPIA